MLMSCEPIAGTSMEDSARDAIRLAYTLHVTMHFNFNGILVSVHEVSLPAIVVEKYHEALESGSKFIVC